MAHFAELDNSNKVIRVVVIANDDCLDNRGQESEDVGISFCKSLFGEDGNWKQTSYNRNFRVHYAGPGFTYNEKLDAFIPPQPFASWTLNEERCSWDPPVPYPTVEDPTKESYLWNESLQEWYLDKTFNLENQNLDTPPEA
jgi:hypothetical protein